MKADVIVRQNTQTSPALLDYRQWLAAMGKTPITGWRWRKRGIVQTVNIFGRIYIAQDEAERFINRAKAGEFSKEHRTPRSRKDVNQ